MFAPSQHLGRSYGAPGTVRRQRTNENAGVHLPTKTPVRAPLGGGGGGPLKPGPGTVGRPLGLKTLERNVLAPKPDHSVDDIGPKRLFQNSKPSSSQQALLKPMKTPAPTRHALRTPAPQRLPDPDPLPLPSAQRTRRRSRSSLSSQHTHSTPDQSFATPAPAHRWEEEVSLDSIVEADVEEAVNGGDGSDYELEYAPPTAIDRPFIPEWAGDIPDPIESIKAIAAMRPLFFHDPPSPPPALQEVDLPNVTLCSADELEHPLLRRPKPKATVASSAKPRLGLAARTPGSAPPRPGVTSRPLARPATTIPSRSAPASAALNVARSASATGTKSASSRLTSRPATAMAASVRSTARSIPPTPRTATGTMPRVGLASGARSGTTATTTGRPIRAAAAPAKPKSPFLAPVAAPDMDGFDLGLDLDVLGPDPAAAKIEEVEVVENIENVGNNENTEKVENIENIAVPSIENMERNENVDAPYIEKDENDENIMEVGATEAVVLNEVETTKDEPQMPPPASTAAMPSPTTPLKAPSFDAPSEVSSLDTPAPRRSAPEISVAEVPALEFLNSYVTAESVNVDTSLDSLDFSDVTPVLASMPVLPANPKVTLTAPDTSAEITQNFDASFIHGVVAATPAAEGPSEAGSLSVPIESEFVQEPETAPPMFDDSSFNGDSYELQDMSRPERGAATPPESWVDDDMSFTDDVLAAAMENCALNDRANMPFDDSDSDALPDL